MWNAEWGGELLISRERGMQTALPFDNTAVSEQVMSQGLGTWIAPKPNRLVFTMNDVLHKVAKTTVQAGARLTIQGFLLG
jgi:Rps23 Pro-64 3,4-dihydroxylase Tpa1-like proline 4-hydroxylase